MNDVKWGDPIGDTGFLAGSPESRALWLWHEVGERYGGFDGAMMHVLGDGIENYREGWSPVKNEPHELAFLRMVDKLIAAQASND